MKSVKTPKKTFTLHHRQQTRLQQKLLTKREGVTLLFCSGDCVVKPRKT